MLRREPTQRVRNLEKKKKAGQCYPKSKQASQAGRKSIFIQLPAAGILPSQYSTPWLGKNGKQGRCLQQGVWDIPGERTKKKTSWQVPIHRTGAESLGESSHSGYVMAQENV